MERTYDMNIQPIDGSTYMIILTTGLYVLTVITWQSLAGIAATLAGFSTLAYNCYRFYNDYKKNKLNKKE